MKNYLTYIKKFILEQFGLFDFEIINKTNYVVDLNDLEKDKLQILSSFLLEKSSLVSWTNYSDWTFISNNWEYDREFQNFMSPIKSCFIKKTIDNIEYGEKIYSGKPRFSHFYFRIEGSVENLIHNDGPIVAGPGFWDPIYFKDNKIVAITIAHESLICLNLSDEEVEFFANNGIRLSKRIV